MLIVPEQQAPHPLERALRLLHVGILRAGALRDRQRLLVDADRFLHEVAHFLAQLGLIHRALIFAEPARQRRADELVVEDLVELADAEPRRGGPLAVAAPDAAQ